MSGKGDPMYTLSKMDDQRPFLSFLQAPSVFCLLGNEVKHL